MADRAGVCRHPLGYAMKGTDMRHRERHRTGIGCLRAAVSRARGREAGLAAGGAEQLMAHEALGAHARDELGSSERAKARPLQAALASAASFALGAALPLAVTALGPRSMLIPLVAGASLVSLVILGVLAARASAAPVARSALRVAFWGALAMAVTAGVVLLFGAPTG